MSPKTFSPKVCIVGAGFSGICAAMKLQTELNVTSFSIFDKHAKVGGVWASHCYPGLSSNISAPAYCFSFDPKLDWTKAFPEPNEIQNYAESLCTKHNLWPHIQLETEVSQLVWNESDKKWIATIKSLKDSEFMEEQMFDLVFLGTGPLRVPNIPDKFRGFGGLVMHTAQWDPSVTVDSLKDKNVGIMGTGESGSQIAGALGSKVKSLHVYQRHAIHFVDPKMFTWIYSCQPYLRNTFFTFIFFWAVFLLHTMFHYAAKSGSWIGTFMAKLGKKHRHSIIPPEKSSLRKALEPKEDFFCRPAGPEFNFYKSILLPNVTLHSDPIVSVRNNGLVTANEENVEEFQHLDVLILATGYKTDEYFGPMKIFGRNGKDILESWKLDGPKSYFGVVNSDMPNLFRILGMSSINSALTAVEVHVNFTIRLLKIMVKKDKKSVLVKPEAESAYQRELERNNSQMNFTKCKSFLVDSKGNPITFSSVSPVYYHYKLRFVNQSDFIFT